MIHQNSSATGWSGRKGTLIAGGIMIAMSIGAGLVQYSGSPSVFVAFSLVFFAILTLSILHPRDYAHLFLAAMWFVGFWLKFVLHEAAGWPYQEPTGNFEAAPANWDHVLIVCTVGGVGFLAGRLATLLLSTRLKGRWRENSRTNPVWYSRRRRVLWAVAIVAIVSAVLVNWRFAIFVRGEVAQTILPWPLGGLFAWTTDIGLALAISILTAWDRQCGLGTMRGFVWLCVEGAAMSLSTSSRGLFVFHTLPFFVAENPWRAAGMRRAPLLALFAAWLMIAAAIPAGTTFLRLFGPGALPTGHEQLDAAVKASPQEAGRATQRTVNGAILMNQGATYLRLLLIDRWVGLEGVMSTSAYAGKNYGLLARAAFQRRSYGAVDIYTRDISRSGFSEVHAQRFHYASPAGPIAFLYFSGSLWVVFAGMALIAMLMTVIELLWTWLIRDPLPLAIAGWYLAFIVLQLGGGLQQAVTGPIMVTLLFAVARLMSAVTWRPATTAPA